MESAILFSLIKIFVLSLISLIGSSSEYLSSIASTISSFVKIELTVTPTFVANIESSVLDTLFLLMYPKILLSFNWRATFCLASCLSSGRSPAGLAKIAASRIDNLLSTLRFQSSLVPFSSIFYRPLRLSF